MRSVRRRSRASGATRQMWTASRKRPSRHRRVLRPHRLVFGAVSDEAVSPAMPSPSLGSPRRSRVDVPLMSFNEIYRETLDLDPDSGTEFPPCVDDGAQTPGFLTPRE